MFDLKKFNIFKNVLDFHKVFWYFHTLSECQNLKRFKNVNLFRAKFRTSKLEFSSLKITIFGNNDLLNIRLHLLNQRSTQ